MLLGTNQFDKREPRLTNEQSAVSSHITSELNTPRESFKAVEKF